MSDVITFTTDFGLADGYVAAMKGVVLGINPDASLVDICHTVRPQDITGAAYVLSTAYEFFPPRTVHLVVVDPGVGTGRKAVILRTPEADFVAPDNGVLSYIIHRYSSGGLAGDQCRLETGSGLEAIDITRSEFWRHPVSATFHGRDIFAPVAARLSLGTPLSEFGEPLDSLTVLHLPHPERLPDGSLTGYILHTDGFGNLISNIRQTDLPQNAANLTISVGKKVITGLSNTYVDDVTGLIALVGSSGYLEIALPGGSAADLSGAFSGDKVRINVPDS
jgi:S-adenosylmethionine hydrolase